MRLAIVTRSACRRDGQGRVNLQVALAAASRGYEVILYCEEGDQGPETSGLTMQVMPAPRYLPSRLLRDQVLAWRSRRRILKDRPAETLVLANGFSTWAASDLNAAHFVHRAWMGSPHHPWRERRSLAALYPLIYSKVNMLLERMAFRRCDMVIAVSSNVAREVQRTGVPGSQIVTIPNGVDTTEFHPASTEESALIRAKLHLPECATLALFAGDLKTPRKNLGTVLQSLRDVEGMHLVVAGRYEGTEWQQRAKALGIADRVHFLGFQQDMAMVMRAMDLFVFPTRYEPFGLVLLEALASGLPVVTTRSAGVADIVTPQTGFVLSDSEDAAALSVAMSSLANDADMRDGMSQAARMTALQYGWPNVVQRYLELMDQAMARRRNRDAATTSAASSRLVSHA